MKKGNKKSTKKKYNQKGFTMIELVLVIAVLGILSAVALPSFFDLTSNAKVSARDGIIGAVRGGINMVRSNNLATGVTPAAPTTLDAQADGACTTCFGSVLQDALSDSKWTKAGLVYTWTDGTTTTTCTYDGAGAFPCS